MPASLIGQKRRVRMRDVATRCGVSISTVSLVLSGDARIPEDTARKVLQTVKAMEYRPSVLARSLARKGSRTIAVILHESAFAVNQPFYYQALEGIHDQTQPSGYKMLVEAATRAFLDRRYYLRLLKEQSVDGVVYMAASIKDNFLNEMARENYPFVLLGHRPAECDLPFVGTDEALAARMATEHLLKLGHKKIGFIAGPSDIWSGPNREKGYREALQTAEIVPEPNWIARCDFDPAKAEAAAVQLHELGMTAMLAASDWMAAGAIKGLFLKGLHVPSDVSVVGIEDLPIASITTPPLTTVRLHVKEMASQAAKTVLTWVNGPLNQRPNLETPVSPELIVRSSSGSPKS
jgi:DNA-binding LacI/PurR family transcriptional regulator